MAGVGGDEDAPRTLLSLPDDLLAVVARHCLVVHLPAAVRLATLCRRLRAGLQPVVVEATAKRLRWLPSHTMRHRISSDGRTLTKSHANGHDCSCAAGPLLPSTGKSAWRVRIEEACDRGADLANSSFIGVCDASGRSEWGLDLNEGTLVHLRRNHKGQIVELGDNRASRPLGDSVRLRGEAAGSVIEVIVDHDLGTLSFRANEGPATVAAAISLVTVDKVIERDGRRGGGRVDAVVAACDSVERGVALRPYASLGLARSARPDCVSFCDGYVLCVAP